ncbi:MAG: prepilin-type cleavage/methylation domain-containing protein [Desulfobacter postgatei]|uniref:Prepilin-type cleavage/methylation domain-containing protein n=1 Tax=Desulfobacter postgatei TaxID=2293 RepID=A0A2G6MS30_9BACT|nr:MAG: prepilin-type cleavage/methylation domain-containing protein [Desulfobacter postgatei]
MNIIIKNQNGFTLIEAMIAMMVLAVGILGINTMHVSSTRGNSSANKLTIAGATGENIYETLISQSYSDAVFDAGTHTINDLPGFVLPGSISAATWNVTQWSNTDGVDNDGDGTKDEDDESDIKFVTLTVTYTDAATKRLTINFLKSEIY